MTPYIDEQLRATGIAQVIVVLHAVPAKRQSFETSERMGMALTKSGIQDIESVASGLSRHFFSSELSQDGALATAARSNASRTTRGALSGMLESTRVVDAPLPVPKVRLYKNLGLMLGTTDRVGVAALEAAPSVQSVTGAPAISLIRPVVLAAARLAGQRTWGLERLGIPEVWRAGFTGKGVLIGHLDTGVDGKHPALKGAIEQFAEFDPMGEPVAGAEPHDSGQHGTHTAGTIVGRRIRTTSFGVAPEARLASALVIEGGNVIARILGGMDWVVGLGAKVLSMSLGLRGFTPDFLPVTQVLRNRGVLPVFAVGNEGPGTSRSPGNYAEALSVGAVDRHDQVADFSSSQHFQRPNDPVVPDLVAPGVEVLSCVPAGGFAEMSGTSMATPHIAGLAALLWQAKMTATVDEVEAALFASCQRPPAMLVERGNRGIPNGPRALAALLGSAQAAKSTRELRQVSAGKPAVARPKGRKKAAGKKG